MVTLNGFPMPPSINSCYRNLSIKGNLGRVKSASYRKYEYEVKNWANKNLQAVDAARELVSTVGPGLGLGASYLFFFDPSRVLMKSDVKPNIKSRKMRLKKKNESKMLDVSNFLKAVEDQMGSVIEIDDAYFWSVSIAKMLAIDGKPESVDITLFPKNHPTI